MGLPIYLPMNSWRGVAPVVQVAQALLASDPPEPLAWQVCL
jgi:hypothetical protein